MERNAHRLTLHSPARESLPLLGDPLIDIDQVFSVFLHAVNPYNQPLTLQPVAPLQPYRHTHDHHQQQHAESGKAQRPTSTGNTAKVDAK